MYPPLVDRRVGCVAQLSWLQVALIHKAISSRAIPPLLVDIILFFIVSELRVTVSVFESTAVAKAATVAFCRTRLFSTFLVQVIGFQIGFYAAFVRNTLAAPKVC